MDTIVLIIENHYACPLSQRETARLSSTPFTPRYRVLHETMSWIKI